ncbi:DUF1642 domain-containing protein [Streptococcus suis]|uniref:Phage protein n=1 Tax=Streptococcus suis TaxID=1307 RepID=A0A0Z8H8H5_STRSU|nr:DUF1642 domain-containing protein [Streptococcus suis]QBX30953.1 hypothetical protein Javan584_0015 [Streptococcus phage Javan584]NQH64379.1 DUF1642 domain-containing protein [Streptococcus suis]NQP29062.1 DUF1642 domain-containing protein [Streptococcus suis]NQS05880.1 DUF1642 domain-containing protein [Streptococcus suis]CYV12461.1 phage protein [Streptococcus suis]
MNKQEAINELKKYKVGFGEAAAVRFDRIVSVINQIHEPQKLVVPKFVAEWIEECKRSGWHLEKVLYRLDDDGKVGDWAYDENDDLIPKKVDMIARAWLNGYEIEQEKLYTVEFPTGQRLYKNHPNGSDKVAIVIKFAHHAEKDGHFTKRELEETGFGWVFDCDGVKVVEVE